MIIAQLIILATLFISAYSYGCTKVEEGYEEQDIMYSVCPNFPELPNDSVSKIVHILLSQYKGPPDEIFIYFVASEDSIGKEKYSPGELLGYYYTHNHQIVIWPNTPQEKVVEVTWKQ